MRKFGNDFFSYRIKITDPLQHFDVILEYFLIPLRIKITLKMCKICKELVKIERFYRVSKSAPSYCFKVIFLDATIFKHI